MRDLLRQRNAELGYQVELLFHLLEETHVPRELELYKLYVLRVCESLRIQIKRNLSLLQLSQYGILDELLGETTEAIWCFRLLSGQFSVPILRAADWDRLSLSILSWLHRQHIQTQDRPAAVASGMCSVVPFQNAPVYYFPSVEQRGLLYQPLLFHEFGHFIYYCHKPEMDDLVSELREDVVNSLSPMSRRNDRYSEERSIQRQRIADTWYSWAQELFCDAVGFQIGGPSFLKAFSSFLGVFNEADFYRPPKNLQLSDHPVTWLRVHFLTDRAADAGFPKLAKSVQQRWEKVAKTIGMVEDYHGFYHESLSEVIEDTLSCMLTEASPYSFTSVESAGGGWSPCVDSPIRLLNWAWQVYETRPDQYTMWEAEQVDLLLSRLDHI